MRQNPCAELCEPCGLGFPLRDIPLALTAWILRITEAKKMFVETAAIPP
jgi:hypothetical protein